MLKKTSKGEIFNCGILLSEMLLKAMNNNRRNNSNMQEKIWSIYLSKFPEELKIKKLEKIVCNNL